MIRDLCKRYKEWLSLFSSAFIGTLLGIGITFGISAYLEQQKKEDIAHKILVITLNEIANHLETIEDEIPSMRRTDSIFFEILTYYPNELDEVPDTLASSFVADLGSMTFGATQSFAEQLFINNIESLESFDDLSIICDINELFTSIHRVTDIKNKAAETKTAIFKTYTEKADYFSMEKSGLENLFEDSKVYTDIIYHKSFTESLVFLVELYKMNFKSVMQNLGIDEEDIKRTKSTRGAKIDGEKKVLDLSY